MKSIWIMLLIVSTMACSHKEKKHKENYSPVVSFEEAGTRYESKVMLPKEFKDKVPLVVVVPEWWGKNAYIENRARMLTEQGYAALPVDMYGNGKIVDNPKDAMANATPFYQNPQMGVDRLNRYIEMAKQDPHVDPTRIYVIGYCFGGSQALNLARSGADVKGVVSFHGGLMTGYKGQDIKARILALNGAADPMVPRKDVKAFEKEMKAAKADYRIVNYKGATHAFTNPDATANGKKFNIPIAYDKNADEASWKELMDFLSK